MPCGRPKLPNLHWIIGPVALIDVSTKTHPRAVALVDAVDLALVIDGNGRWSARRGSRYNLYARRTRGPKNEMLHALLLGCADSIGDHKSGDSLDNRRLNIRRATRAENNRNRRGFVKTSRFKGVSLHQRTGLWLAQIRAGATSLNLGIFHDERHAAEAYDAAALIHHGAFARLNFRGGE
jgi:AP2 domain